MKAIILAGGSGTRLWPLSRKNYPKQFLKLNGGRSLLQQTAERLLRALSPEEIVVMTNDDYKFHVKNDLDSVGNMVLEPACRNTAPAIALGIKYCSEKLGCDEDEVIFVSPSDHVITPSDRFAAYLRLSEEMARQGHIVTFGIKPTRPETGYGYIKVDSKQVTVDRKQEGVAGPSTTYSLLPTDFYRVEKFVEKPDRETAERYVEDGNYYWNSGMFAFRIGTMTEELRKYAPEIAGMFDTSFEEMLARFSRLPDISIDYAVMEKSDKVVTQPLDLYWNDVGSWDSLYDLLEKDGAGNVRIGDVIDMDTSNTMIVGGKRLVSTVGLDNCLIVETDDAILIAKRGQAQKVREVVATLRERARTEADEHVTTYRPWGSYTVLEEGPRYKIKKIVVKPLAKLSYQQHYHRSEHWVVVRGTARVTIGEKEVFIHENESAYVPKSTFHRLENPGKVPLEIIEVQNGEYVGEDDIVRTDDIYGRQADCVGSKNGKE